jgi:hypothetical protein
MTAGLTLGAPGIYRSVVPAPRVGLPPIRLDATGFVGMAFRGPANAPVAVSSWSQFVELFGGVSDADAGPAPGFLPRAVRAFFDQGGRTAWVCRVVPTDDDPDAVATFALPELAAQLVAADEGSWGGRLEVSLTYESGPRLPMSPEPPAGAVRSDENPAEHLVLGDVPAFPAGSLLVVAPAPGRPIATLHWVTAQELRAVSGGGRVRVLAVDPPLAPDTRGPGGVVDARVVTATIVVLDRDPLRRRSERITGLGLRAAHPQYPARELPPDHPQYPGTVLSARSRLVHTGGGWGDDVGPRDGTLSPVAARPVHGGRDRWTEVGGDSLFDDVAASGAADAELLDERAHRGVDRVGAVEGLGLLCVPDLTWEKERGHLDAASPDDLAEISGRQARLVAAAAQRQVVALLDAPSRLSADGLLRWRADFDSSYAAAYHPWLAVTGDGPGRLAVPLPPSAAAAGVIAARENRLGLAWGPANEIAVGVVSAQDLVPDAVHDQLHLAGINVFRAERDGFRLTAARTLSTDVRYRQLSVRRLMTMITLAVERQAQALVFEPNTAQVRAALFHTLTQFLRDLFRRGAFAGDTEQSSYFVRCDDRLNPAASVAAGRLVAEIGVAPSSPLEYLVLRISQDVDGGTAVAAPSPASAPADEAAAPATRRRP